MKPTPRGAILAAVAACLAVGVSAAAVRDDPEPRAEQGLEVRRHEFVVLVRTAHDSPGAPGRAEAAAFRAGGAVLESVRGLVTARFTDHRWLVRTRSAEVLGRVLREIRRERGVLGASAIQLPEIPTGPGSPSFLSAYTAAYDGPESGVVVRHDVPQVLDRRDLLETSSVPVGPALAPTTGAGGVGLNISELFRRMRARSWARREARMKNAYLPILPPGAGAAAGDGAGPTP